ncbi:hypothetical protein GLOIN_2v1800435 [Rhizophagus irregularis DAOM 181602=DAOM 197198]|uniref:Uncharacterized protein n=1 Tax=Rhizophagus irregularis (strain DAOM 181602 / DAOM 197198 / MUCL 43194) TaxID=747089 RepID=A0A2P4QSD0_RHIID|nr:hypothetical protein GLOIN_2v1800435 [Rhizophagus irregularis DAOM 181602=DAOM 197198]POG80515.1 hypothetical protein GLOIN_2v1800435 [Rhizophagus irregularis DAOM 181602=DAOM 197198]|eukprot:XP_025187381.1 hypothetical protein GLOIN_2v1800435 [Rhizophagus irregularis DAOM 181602=DAOM 197198]
MQSTSIQVFQQQQEEISKIRPGIVANFIYKVVELATYTSDFADDAINILTGGHSTRQNYGYDDNDDENVYVHKKKDVSTWNENVETVEDEEPPSYDNSTETKSSLTISTSLSQQDYPTTQSETEPSFTISSSLSQRDYPTTQTETKPSFTISTSLSQQDYPTTQSTPTHSPTNSTSRQRQFRVRRGCRFVRHKSSSKMSNNFNNTSDNNDDDDDDIILKRLNSKISVMIAEAEAALNSKAEVTELEMILAEEKERDERIRKEFGIQTLNIHNYNYNNYNINYNNNHNYVY